MSDQSSSVEGDHSFAVVTPTFLPDLKRCELLVESLDRTVPGVAHYLIVDRRDLRSFRHLTGGRRVLIESETLLRNWIWRLPGPRGFWVSLKALPARGWIVQQILKIAAIEQVKERTLIFCDSDTAFFRPFRRDNLLVDGKVGLLDVEPSLDSAHWTSTAQRLLGAGPSNNTCRNHVGNMICWNREVIEAMQQRMESATGMDWRIALARTRSFSEYMIYGVFVRDVLGYNNVDHAPSTVPLVKPSWGLSLSSRSAMDAFFADFPDPTVAVMIHSKDNIDPSLYRPYLERLWLPR